MKIKDSIQFIIGICFVLFGVYQAINSFKINDLFAQGALIGESCVFFLWGWREVIGDLIK